MASIVVGALTASIVVAFVIAVAGPIGIRTLAGSVVPVRPVGVFTRVAVMVGPVGRPVVVGRPRAVVMVAHTLATAEVHVAVRTGVIVAASPPAMAVIAHINSGAVKVVVAITVMVADRVVPARTNPAYGAEEIVECAVQVVLPVKQDEAQVAVAVAPVVAGAVAGRSDAHQVV